MSIIKELGLSEEQVYMIINEWYLQYPDIIQDEHGRDLEEICELQIFITSIINK